MGELLTADEVAERLGVALPTVYAYASRGALTRRPTPGDRRSRYDSDEVELLVQRARPRSLRRRPGAVDVVIGTTVSEIGDGWIRYRDHDLVDLAGHHRFEHVAHLLWTGHLPDRPAMWPDAADVPAWRSAAEVARRVSQALPASSSALARLAVGAAAASSSLPLGATDPAIAGAVLVDALVAALPVVGAVDPGPDAPVAARLWARTSPLTPTPARVAVLDLALVLLAEHELATSTLAVRVAASTGAGPAEVVLAGLGAVSGPLHGRAAVSVHNRLLASGHRSPAAPLQDGPQLDGFGHLVHRRGDPRFPILRDAALVLAPAGRRAVIEVDLIAHAAAGAAPPNIDAALGALAFVARAEPGASAAVFAVARTAGWLAHAFEEADELPLRYRGRTIYRRPR